MNVVRKPNPRITSARRHRGGRNRRRPNLRAWLAAERCRDRRTRTSDRRRRRHPAVHDALRRHDDRRPVSDRPGRLDPRGQRHRRRRVRSAPTPCLRQGTGSATESASTRAASSRCVTVEDDVFIAPNVVFADDPHPPCPRYEECVGGALVKSVARIGSNSTILPGVVIGRGALVGAGSVVVHDVPDGVVVAGSPARIIKRVDELECQAGLFERPYGADVSEAGRPAVLSGAMRGGDTP